MSEKYSYPPSVIAIGNIGSGKTTSLDLLSEAASGRIVASDTIFFTIPTKDAYLEAIKPFDFSAGERADVPPKEWSRLQGVIFDHERGMLRERMDFIKDQVSEVSAANLTPVIDSGPLMNWAYTWGHRSRNRISEEHWNEFNKEYDDLTGDLLAKGTVVYMKDTPQNCRKRIESRAAEDPGRAFELSAYTIEYLSDLHNGLEAFTRTYQGKSKIVTVPVAEIGNIAREQGRRTAFVKRARSMLNPS